MRDHLLAGALVCLAAPALADQVQARCDIHPKGSDTASASVPCTFSQRQGHVTIARGDGVVHDLTPDGDVAGNFTDAGGSRVYRNGGLGDRGLIFRTPEESVFVHWEAAGLVHPEPRQ